MTCLRRANVTKLHNLASLIIPPPVSNSIKFQRERTSTHKSDFLRLIFGRHSLYLHAISYSIYDMFYYSQPKKELITWSFFYTNRERSCFREELLETLQFIAFTLCTFPSLMAVGQSRKGFLPESPVNQVPKVYSRKNRKLE